MKMTMGMRDAIVGAIMLDIPRTDYTEQMRAVAMEWAISKMPPAVAAIYAKTPEWIEKKHCWHSHREVPSMSLPVLDRENLADERIIGAKLAALGEKAAVQSARMGKLRHELTQTISAFSTVKKFTETFPELAKYAPAEAPPTSNLPVPVSEVIRHLKGAGWKAKAVQA
jgi:hypothetical protein